MARGKGKYNKDCERSRQEIKQMIAKYSGGDAVLRLRQKLTKKDQIEKIQKDIDRAYRNHYNVCINGFEKRSLEKKSPKFNMKNYR